MKGSRTRRVGLIAVATQRIDDSQSEEASSISIFDFHRSTLSRFRFLHGAEPFDERVSHQPFPSIAPHGESNEHTRSVAMGVALRSKQRAAAALKWKLIFIPQWLLARFAPLVGFERNRFRILGRTP
jgi:hypothetical protein